MIEKALAEYERYREDVDGRDGHRLERHLELVSAVQILHNFLRQTVGFASAVSTLIERG